jgi:hypothetical protein
LAALLINFSVPVEVPTLCGVNLISNVAVPPALRLVGTWIPVTPYPLPDKVSPESVTVAFPVFAIVTVSVCVRPTGTRPKLTALGVNFNSPLARAGVAPVPMSAKSKAKKGTVRWKIDLFGLKEMRSTLLTRAWHSIAFPLSANAIG